MEIQLVQGDITQMQVDVIVNAANSGLLGGGGVDGAIHRAGGPVIMDECRKIRARQGGCPTGEAVITNAGNLKAHHVIHTVGPVWQGGRSGESEKLRACYVNSLKLADEHLAGSIAFPNISTGVYAYPKSEAARVAVDTVRNYHSRTIKKVIFVCFDAENYALYQHLL
ncbi:O-acetyl-ADP-ribose deacetylase [Carboxylicivirga taeanensis]|uniref:O-acetyl-ADP-ribose deacetylase n=1 Tax=Carboxylicivirga taeanensis TaxID=1416875 RepID=UPI003F6DCC28